MPRGARSRWYSFTQPAQLHLILKKVDDAALDKNLYSKILPSFSKARYCYPLDNTAGITNTYPLDSDLSSRWRYQVWTATRAWWASFTSTDYTFLYRKRCKLLSIWEEVPPAMMLFTAFTHVSSKGALGKRIVLSSREIIRCIYWEDVGILPFKNNNDWRIETD